MGNQPHGLFTEHVRVARGVLQQYRSKRRHQWTQEVEQAVHQLGEDGLPVGKSLSEHLGIMTWPTNRAGERINWLSPLLTTTSKQEYDND